MSFGFGFALPAYPLRGGGGNNPFNQLGPTLDLSFAGVVTDQSDPNGYTLNTNFIIPQYQIAAQYVVWETGVGLVDKTFSQIITFTRASTGTFFDSAGVLTSAAIDAPRFDYDPSTLAAQGLLIEEARTNLCLQSEDFATTWTVTGATVSTNATTAPSGTTTADKLEEDTSTGSHLVTQNITFTAVSHTASIFAKKAERDWIRVLFFDGTNTFSAFFNLNTGTVGTITGAGATASIQNVGNGWYRCAVTATASAGSGSFAPRVALADNNSSYAGSAGSGIFLWGAQLEAGAFPTSYIPTTTTALTRAADVASVNTLSPWFNSVTGTLYAEYNIPVAVQNQNAVALTDGTNNNRMIIRAANSSTQTIFIGVDTSVTQWSAALAAAPTNATTKSSFAYATNDIAWVRNAGTVGTDATATIPTVNQLKLGADGDGTSRLSGWLRRVTYYPRKLSSAELQAITA